MDRSNIETLGKLESVTACDDLIEKARSQGDENIEQQALRRKFSLLAEEEQPANEAERECYEAIFAYEELLTQKNSKPTKASRTWQVVRREGILPAVENIVSKKEASPGYSILIGTEYEGYLFESVILRHPEDFPQKVVDAAQNRFGNMSRKQFIELNGATCDNWTWSWSFVNHEAKYVIFGAWDRHTTATKALILSGDWRISKRNKKMPGFTQSREHIRLIEEEGYALKTFPIVYSDEKQDEDDVGPAKIDHFNPILSDKNLQFFGGDWYAVDIAETYSSPDEVEEGETFIEGAKLKIKVNAYERNPEARRKCVEHHGYTCSVCDFNFEDFYYGDTGKEFIHVHHIKPLSEIAEEYIVDPIKDLIPVCPNCHAMIHRNKPALEVEDLRKSVEIMRKYSK